MHIVYTHTHTLRPYKRNLRNNIRCKMNDCILFAFVLGFFFGSVIATEWAWHVNYLCWCTVSNYRAHSIYRSIQFVLIKKKKKKKHNQSKWIFCCSSFCLNKLNGCRDVLKNPSKTANFKLILCFCLWRTKNIIFTLLLLYHAAFLSNKFIDERREWGQEKAAAAAAAVAAAV